jgi:hypothetical protein
MSYTSVKLWMGLPAPVSLGSGPSIEYGELPQSIDLLNGPLTVFTENNQSTWSPQLPAIKNGGIWSDPAASDGRTLLLGRNGNVLEDMRLLLTADVGLARSVIISQLRTYCRAARDFWQNDFSNDPVYLELQAVGSPAPQYALIYNIDMSMDGDVLYSTNSPRITLAIERESAWRAIPPGASPKVHTFYTRGIEPINDATPPSSSYYGMLQLDLDWFGAATYNSLVETSTLRAYDEIVTNNVNYVDIPASSIPGDEPALAVVSVVPVANAPATAVPFMISRSTRPDLFPTANSAVATGSYAARRQRNTLNGGDANVTGSWTKTAEGTYGVLSNGSIVNRYVARHVSPAAATSEYLRWTVSSNQFQSRYAVFVRSIVANGSHTSFSLYFGASPIGVPNMWTYTPRVQMASTSFQVTYLGLLDPLLSGSQVRDENGFQSNQSGFDFVLYLHKPSAVVLDLYITDIILMPIDEPNGLITPYPQAWNVPVGIDSTGALTGAKDEVIARYINPLSDAGRPQEYRGVPITLVPQKRNRLYWLPFTTAPYNVGTYRMRVDIVPRWAGLRTD